MQIESVAQFIARVARAPTERDVAVAVMDLDPDLFSATGVGFYSFDTPSMAPAEIHARFVTLNFLDDYERIRPEDALLRYITTHHAPILVRDEELDRRGEYGEFISKYGSIARTTFAAPIVSGGSCVGTMTITSRAPIAKVDQRGLLAVALHVSSRVSALRALDDLSVDWSSVLTARESEVALVAARGLTNQEIAKQCGVTANTIKKHLKSAYSKLHITRRSELASALARGPAVSTPSPTMMLRGARAYVR